MPQGRYDIEYGLRFFFCVNFEQDDYQMNYQFYILIIMSQVFRKREAAARRCSKMEGRDHRLLSVAEINAASPKSLMSRGNKNVAGG